MKKREKKFTDFFKTTENFSFEEAREEYDEDIFSDDEIKTTKNRFYFK